ncbi:MAG TPA: CBS domain-containing protein [Pseudolabrys sp.]|nr:CBS domain-containing protein [Pseudolabrys sp.]
MRKRNANYDNPMNGTRAAICRLGAARQVKGARMRVDSLGLITSTRLAVIPVDATLRTGALALSNTRIGLLVVCDENRRTAGVVSKSDIVRHLADVGVTDTSIANLMSRNVRSCRREDDLYATWQRMAGQNLQNMPVLSAELVPVGVLDIRDALKVLFEQEEYQEQLLINYVAGVGYQ